MTGDDLLHVNRQHAGRAGHMLPHTIGHLEALLQHALAQLLHALACPNPLLLHRPLLSRAAQQMIYYRSLHLLHGLGMQLQVESDLHDGMKLPCMSSVTRSSRVVGATAPGPKRRPALFAYSRETSCGAHSRCSS